MGFPAGLPGCLLSPLPATCKAQDPRAEGTSPRGPKGGRSCSAINSWLQKAYAVTPAVLNRSHRSALFDVGDIGGQRGVQLSKLLTQWVITAHSVSL